MTCKKLLHKAEEQYDKYLKNITEYKDVTYIKFIGDPTIDKEYIYDQNSQLLKCEDDYLNLPNKVYCFYKAILELFPDVTNVIKMDDDVIINLPNLYDLMKQCKDIPYAGRYVYVGPTLSTWLYQKKDVCSNFPELSKIPVYMLEQAYCAGCIYLLNKNSVETIVKYPVLFPKFPKDHYKEYIKILNGHIQAFVYLNVFEDYNVGKVLTKLNNIPNYSN